MGHANNIITAPVDVYGDIAALFGIASGDVGYLIANANINKWAKYKPMGGSSPASLTDADRVALNQGFKVTASGVDYDSIFCSGAEGTFLIAKQNSADWNYIHNNLTWYRVTDFVPYNPSSSTPYAGNGYVHGVSNPFVKVGTSHVHNVTSSVWQCGLQFYYYARTGGFALTDLKVFNDKGAGSGVSSDATWYWGVVYCVGGTYGYAFCTTTQGGSTLVPVGTPSDPNNGVGIDGYYEIPVTGTTTSVEVYLVAISRVNLTGGVQGFIYIPTIYDADWNIVSYSSPTATMALNWWTVGAGYLYALRLQYSSGYLVYAWVEMQIVVNDAAWGTAGVGGSAYVVMRKKSTGQTASPSPYVFTPSNFSTDSNNNHVCLIRFDDFTSPAGNDPHNPISTSLFQTGDLTDIEIGFYINITTGGTGTAYYDGFGNRVQTMTYSDLSNTAGTSVMEYLTARNYYIENI